MVQVEAPWTLRIEPCSIDARNDKERRSCCRMLQCQRCNMIHLSRWPQKQHQPYEDSPSSINRSAQVNLWVVIYFCVGLELLRSLRIAYDGRVTWWSVGTILPPRVEVFAFWIRASQRRTSKLSKNKFVRILRSYLDFSPLALPLNEARHCYQFFNITILVVSCLCCLFALIERKRPQCSRPSSFRRRTLMGVVWSPLSLSGFFSWTKIYQWRYHVLEIWNDCPVVCRPVLTAVNSYHENSVNVLFSQRGCSFLTFSRFHLPAFFALICRRETVS